MRKNQETIKNERALIMEMIDASCALAEHLGRHPLKNDCNCIVCVSQRKRLIDKRNEKWRFSL
ncbi:MAG: hypothetical protein ACE5DO_15610 [Desulfobacterales bacterium]